MRIIPLIVTVVLFFTSCKTFILDENIASLKDMESREYTMKEDIKSGNRSLKKGDKIKITIGTGKEWVKVHGFSARGELLKADKVLILYMFSEDFPDEKFDINLFASELNYKINLKDDVPDPRGRAAEKPVKGRPVKPVKKDKKNIKG
ncbi:MAG: hypothetical protein MUD12_15970 [Spirochaetes bacterium]|jgi:type II secretion system-associated lipoprotein|nr:hypothetical protein [Spirochaetota bacterium]